MLTKEQLEAARIYEAAITILSLADVYSDNAMAMAVNMLRVQADRVGPDQEHTRAMADLIAKIAGLLPPGTSVAWEAYRPQPNDLVVRFVDGRRQVLKVTSVNGQTSYSTLASREMTETEKATYPDTDNRRYMILHPMQGKSLTEWNYMYQMLVST